ncbi:MAG: hypothetical protein H7039_08790 [Bryobacteraceae bacterium]|nr:hypothetical protein [Bryobacteraceae bacterium]
MPRNQGTFTDPNLLEAALEGLLLQKQRLEAQIQEVRSLLGKKRGPRASSSALAAPVAVSRTATRKRELSEPARKRIAAAQKKRWAEYRRKQSRGE